ncbi:MAG: cytochrome c oxidase assembly protein [Terracidiphilus sp.]|nr:cytochrome c oxidase assembly protein [Terracidiphilus sp.]
MNEANALQDLLHDWTLPVPLTCSIVLTAVLYFIGWMRVRRTRPAQFPVWRLVSFEAGMAVLWGSIASPMDELADALLSAHMMEHLLIMSAVPPLVLLGAPVVPMLRGLPRWTLVAVRPLIRTSWLRRAFNFLLKPVPAWMLMNFTYLGWHIPGAYDLALENETWHDIEHLCFLLTSLLFWNCLIRPWPSRQQFFGWTLLPYLVSADLVNTTICASLAFCGRPVYEYYIKNPNPFGVSLLDDQILGAMAMWVLGSIAFLGPAMWITIRLLDQRKERLA